MALTDSLSHPPPTTGALAYDSDIRPALGATYADPVFNETVRRLSDIGANPAGDDLYSHCWGNANGTYIIHSNGNVGPPFDIVLASNGSVVAANQPVGTHSYDVMFHPTNADKYLYYSTTQLLERNIGAQTNSLVKDFGSTLATLGGSVNWCDRTGNIFVVSYGGFAHVWNRSLDLVYTGNIPLPAANGWIGMSPSGNYVETSVDASNWEISYAINHVAHTVDTVGVKFCSFNGNHAIPVTGSDGVDYMVLPSSAASTDGLYVCTVARDRSGLTNDQQLVDTGVTKLLSNIGFIFDLHLAHAPNGAGRDWVFISPECINANPTTGRDLFNGGVPNWLAFKQEIVAVNYLTGAVRRLAHHRSRSIQLSYYYQPRLSCSWDGSLVVWASNMNVSSPASYSDFYAIANPLSAAYHPLKLSSASMLAAVMALAVKNPKMSRRELITLMMMGRKQ